MIKPLLCALSLLLAPAAQACCEKDLADPGKSVPVVDASVSLARSEGPTLVTVLGTLTNTTDRRVDNLVVEARLMDSAGQVVDVLSQPLSGIVIPPSRRVAFRLQGPAAAEARTYARVEARVVSGQSPVPPQADPSPSNTFVDLLVSWGPMLLLIAVWIAVARKYTGKNSAQQRMVAAIGEQNALLSKQLAAIEAIAAAARARHPGGEA